MQIPFFQVDAFTSVPFQGNPAAVCVLEEWLPAEVLRAIARENNLSETAYILRQPGHYKIRWFTPRDEISLCGHATLASAYVVLKELGHPDPKVIFHSETDILEVEQKGDLFILNFPARPPAPAEWPSEIGQALGLRPELLLKAKDYLAVFPDEACIRNLAPDFALLEFGIKTPVIATAPGENCDFVSRYFDPIEGIPEDPVTGSAHCTLIPYWSQRLGKDKMSAKQLSPRGGFLVCGNLGDRVLIGGEAVKVKDGTLYL